MQIHTKALTLRIPKELLAQLSKLARQSRRSRAAFVREILEKAVKTSTFAAALILLSTPGLLSSAAAKDQFVSVEVMSVQTKHWTTTGHKNGSPGTTTTECSGNYNVTCSSTTHGYRSSFDYVIEHTQVNV